MNINLNVVWKLCNYLEVIAPISKKLKVPSAWSKAFWSGERNSKCLEHEYDTKQHKDSSQATAQTTTYDTYCFGRRGVVDEKGRTEAHLWNRWVYSPLYMNQMRYLTIAKTPLLLLGYLNLKKFDTICFYSNWWMQVILSRKSYTVRTRLNESSIECINRYLKCLSQTHKPVLRDIKRSTIK